MRELTTDAAMKPGSDAAILAGCTCPVMDNHRGAGRPHPNGGREFWINGDCPVHAGIAALTQDQGHER